MMFWVRAAIIILSCAGFAQWVFAADQQKGAIVIFDKDETNKRIGELKPAYIDFKYRISPKVPLNELVVRYTRLFHEATDPKFKILALHRLAQLEELFSRQRPEGIISDALWQEAIVAYQRILKDRPYQEGNDNYLYQLARAHEITGDLKSTLDTLQRLVGQYPDSGYVSEAWFRIGELFYGDKRYQKAEQAYHRVVTGSLNSEFKDKAQYMQGWAQFKQDNFTTALATFVKVLDGIERRRGSAGDNSGAEKVEQDTLRITSLILTNLDGPETLIQAIAGTQSDLAPALFDRLYRFYLEKERYQDAVAAANRFIDEFPLSPLRPKFTEHTIIAFTEGKLPSSAWQAKERYVSELGPASDYWQQLDAEYKGKLNAKLYQFFDQLGQRNYALAGNAEGQQKTVHLQQAADYFLAMTGLYPREEASANAFFLAGEAFFQLGQWDNAILAYEQAGYLYPDYANNGEAAYAAILAYQQWLRRVPDDEALRNRRVDALTEFARVYPEDARAPDTLLLAANELFSLEQYQAALDITTKLTAITERKDVLQAAWQTLGHSAFALEKYDVAENGYLQTLNYYQVGSSEYVSIEENLAAAIYSQGEQYDRRGQLAAALEQYQRVLDVAPESSVRLNAQYDAAMRAIDLKAWDTATTLLNDFRSRFTDHQLAEGIPEKLVYVYQQNQELALAAGELESIAASEANRGTQQKALLQAAELYGRVGQWPQAARINQQVLADLSPAFPLAVELHQTQIDIYQKLEELPQVNSWQQALVEFEANGGAQRDGRTKSLAAAASWTLLQADKRAFDAIRLTLPLKKTLAQKQRVMKRLITQLNRTRAYGVSEFSTAALHMTGEIYLRLGQDIMASERPKNLSELELEQYSLLLEEQAFPFEDKAIEILESNARYAQQGVYDDWVKQSYQALSTVLPVRYNKQEVAADVPVSLN